MANKYLLLVLLFILPIISFGQVKFSNDFKIKTGKLYKVVDAPSKLYFPVNGEFVISIKTKGETVTLQLYDAVKMMEVKRHEYKDFPKYSKVQDVVSIGEKMYYVFEAFNKKNDNFSVYIREINSYDATFGKIIKLFTTKEVVVGSVVDPLETTKAFNIAGMKLGPKFKIYKSFDESKIMIGYRNKPKIKSDKKNKDIIGVQVYDTDFNFIWGNEKKMPYTEADINNLAYGISGNGLAYMLIYNNASGSYSALTLTENGEMKEHKLNIDGDKLVQRLEIREDDEGNMIFAGFYANGIDFKVSWTGSASLSFNTNGILYFEMNKDGDVMNYHDYPFSIDFINEYQTSRQKKKSNKREADDKAGIEDLKMIEFVVNDDGSAIFMGEQRYMRKEMYGMKQELVFHYYHIVLAKIDRNGELEWMVKMPKNQAGKNGRGGMGTKYMQGNNNHYLLYLDDEENANISINDAPVPYKDGSEGFLSAYVVDDETGKVEKHQILTMKNINGIKAYQFKTSRIFNLKDNVSMLEIYTKGKKDTMVKLELVN